MSIRLTALLNVHSYFSFGAGVVSPTKLVTEAARAGYDTVALTDDLGVYGAAELFDAAKAQGIRALIGASIPLSHKDSSYPLVLLASSRKAYGVMNELLSLIKGHDEAQCTLSMLEAHNQELHVLTGGRRGFINQLMQAHRLNEAGYLIEALKDAFHDRLWVQLFYDHYPWDRRRMAGLRRFARAHRVPVVAASEVRYASAEQFPLYDSLICGRLGISLADPHPDRPVNDCQGIADPSDLFMPYPEAIDNANALAERCAFELLPERLIPPPARVPDGYHAEHYLEDLCREALLEKYQDEAFMPAKDRLERELFILKSVGFADFFLVVKEIMDFCRSRGILASGRGSAAGSVICYLLGITQADPIAHNLLFERFLHTGKRGMPDIDVDIASSRREEVFAWLEQRFPNSAMVCNRNTYYLPSAIQDIGRALGIPTELRNSLSKALGRDYRGLRPHRVYEAEEVFDEVLGAAPVKAILMRLLSQLEKGFVRHITPHSGGWLLSTYPISHYSPLERSSGGLRLVQFDKDDIERLGLMKLDLLGLRILGAFSHCREEVLRTEGIWLDLGTLPDDPEVWRNIHAGDTMTLFQIESPGQTRMSVQLKPESKKDLKDQVALFRPGPIQSHTVHPYVRRRQHKEDISYPHSSLQPILERSYGVLLFQEQIMEIAHHFAGFSWEDADSFRKKVSSFEDEHEIRSTYQQFLEGAHKKVGATSEEAQRVFELCAAFRGFGFAESHAWAFGLHAYTSAWLKHHYPAEYLAGVMTEQPGMYSANTLRQEARRLGVGFGRLNINRSSFHYLVERNLDGSKFLRPPLSVLKAVTSEVAKGIVLERMQGGPFSSLEDASVRLALDLKLAEALARGGAFDTAFGYHLARREVLYQLTVLSHSNQPAQPSLFSLPEPPPFPPLGRMEQTRWDYQLKGFSEHEIHPVDLYRQQLLGLGATPMDHLQQASGQVRTAGLVVARQKPPSAKGFAFFLLEDGIERIQLVIHPDLWAEQRKTLRDARILLTEGKLQRENRAWTLQARAVWALESRL